MTVDIWCYVSESLLPPGNETMGIHDIVSSSRRNNKDLDVSGALIFARGRFAQYLEGPAHGMITLRAAILGDQRHAKLTTLREGAAEDRRFGAWSMAYAGPASFVSRAMERPLVDALHGSEESVDALIRLISGLARASTE